MSSGIIREGKLNEEEYLSLKTFVNKTHDQCTEHELELRSRLKLYGKL